MLIADEKDNRLVLADFSSQQVTHIGRVGRGPREYRQVGRLWAIGADSTLMIDPFSRRRYVIVGDQLLDIESDSARPSENGLIAGANNRGGVAYAIHSLTKAGKLTGLRDSMFVVRTARPGAPPDTFARIPSEHANYDPTKAVPVMQLGRAITRTYKVSMVELDHLIMFPDGWVAIARTNPYRVDWCPPAQQCLVGATIDTIPATVTDADKEAYLRASTFTRGWPDTLEVRHIAEWPTRFLPFEGRLNRIDASPLVPGADGSLLIERVASAAEPPVQYDIIDRQGKRVRRLQLPANQHIVAAGSRYLYVASTNADGVQRLQRHDR